ncbi:MAG: hypothetical protein JST70_08345 [Bacteroidetes bacterium]|nr:hypothetical protein [Bacteroidota bacterium]
MKKPIRKRRDIFKRVNTEYRVVFIDDESLQEVASFKLTMRKLYTLLSSLFVLVAVVTVCIVLLTPLKYYIPGYGNNDSRRQIIQLQQTVDSLSDLAVAQQQYEDNLKEVITGKAGMKRDTAMLDMKKVNQEAMNNMMPMNEEIKRGAIEKMKQQKAKE